MAELEDLFIITGTGWLPRTPPDIDLLEKAMDDFENTGGCDALDGCRVDADGECEHGSPSILIARGII